jgi:hypothetical protein
VQFATIGAKNQALEKNYFYLNLIGGKIGHIQGRT